MRMTQGNNFEEARDNLIDAIELWITVVLKDGADAPKTGSFRTLEIKQLVVEGILDKIVGNYLEQSAQLFQLIRGIDSRIEPVLLSANEDKSGFLSSILKYGKIY